MAGCFTNSLTCDSFLSSHPSSFYLTGVFSQLHISVLLNQMPAERRAENQYESQAQYCKNRQALTNQYPHTGNQH